MLLHSDTLSTTLCSYPLMLHAGEEVENINLIRPQIKPTTYHSPRPVWSPLHHQDN